MKLKIPRPFKNNSGSESSSRSNSRPASPISSPNNHAVPTINLTESLSPRLQPLASSVTDSSVGSEAEEVSVLSVVQTSDDEEEEEAYERAFDALNRSESDNLSPAVASSTDGPPSTTYGKLSEETAENIIGGSTYQPEENNHSSVTEESSTSDVLTIEKTPKKPEKNQPKAGSPKVFPFSLPFANPLPILTPSIPSLKSFSNLPKLFGNSEDEELRHTLKEKLRRQESMTSLEEELLFLNVHNQDNGALRAMRKTIKTKLEAIPAIPIALSVNTIELTSSDARKLHNSRADPFPGLSGDVVILGGYRGSVLRDRVTGRRVWLPLKAGFNLRKIDLFVGLKDEDEYNMEQHIYPSAMLTHVGPIDVAQRLIRKLEKNGRTKVHQFAYDWRLSSDISSAKLVEFMKTLPCNKGPVKRGAYVICHSMGGLVTHHAVQTNPELFRGVIYTGSPSSCPNILGPLRDGEQLMLSNRILTAQVNFSMRSSYVFLPLDGKCFVDRKTGERYDIDYFNVDNWVEYGLTPAVAKSRMKEESHSPQDNHRKLLKGRSRGSSMRKSLSSLLDPQDAKSSESLLTQSQLFLRSLTNSTPDSDISIPFSDAVEYLDRTLKRTKKFLLELPYDESKDDVYPPMAVVYGNKVPTLRGARIDGLQGLYDGDYTDFVFAPGDGVVYHKTLMPQGVGFKVWDGKGSPRGRVVARVASDEGHIGLMTDIEAFQMAFAKLLEAEAKLPKTEPK